MRAQVWRAEGTGHLYVVFEEGDGGIYVIDEISESLVEVDNVPAFARELT